MWALWCLRIAAAKTRVAQVNELQDVMEGICRQSEITTRASSTPQVSQILPIPVPDLSRVVPPDDIKNSN